VSILGLGRVFVANMTGSVVFSGFALAGAPGFSLAAALSALAGFLLGASVGGLGVSRFAAHRGKLLRNAVAIELVLLLAALLLAVAVGPTLGSAAQDGIAALAAVALGVQNATVRRLAVPDLTTTVLTMTLTGIAADLRARNSTVALRRLLSIAAMVVGAIGGALLVLHTSIGAALAAPVALVAVVTAGATQASRRPAPWQAPG
jgi:uncharacterized membrane protein YoaK (UPF0700 family)